MSPYVSDTQVVVLHTEAEVEVDDKGNMFIVRYEGNRAMVIDIPNSHVGELYVTLVYRNDGQNELYRSVGK